MKTVGPVIENILRSYNLWQGYKQFLVIEKWDDVVGSELSAFTRAESVSNGLLRVAVKDSVWAYHLTMLKPGLVKKLNESVGSNVVKDIYFKIDPFDRKENDD